MQNTSCEVHIRIKDVNDVRPRFYTDPYLAHVPENLDPGHKVRSDSIFEKALIPLNHVTGDTNRSLRSGPGREWTSLLPIRRGARQQVLHRRQRSGSIMRLS